jgi:subtilisin family serine protease
MNPSSKYGRAMMRGTEQFEVEPERSFFTALLENDTDKRKIDSLISPKSIQKIGRRLLKIEVNRADRDEAMAKLRSEDGKIVCHHAYRVPGRKGTRYYLTDLLIVRVLPQLADSKSLFTSHGLEVHKKCEGINDTFSVRVTHKAGKNPLKVAHDLIQRSEVVYAEPNFVERYYLSAPSGGIDWGKLWHLDQISARQAWAHTRGTRDVVIAVVDDGCDLSHPAFGGTCKVAHPTDFVDGDAEPWSDHPAVKSGKHGTACAGLAIAEESENGVVGVASGCAFMPVRMTALGRMEVETLNVRDMFEVVGRHADVISCSWSSVPCYDPIPLSIAEVFDKIVMEGGSRGNGTVICFASGNHNAPIRDDDNHHFEYKPHPRDPEIHVAQSKILNGFAAYPNAIAVAAITSDNQKARYSNWGKEITVCAPSDNFDPLSGQQLPGKELYTTDNEEYGPGYEPGQRFTLFGGTSGACPIVAGVAGLVRSARPDLTALQVKAIIEETADPIPTIGNDSDVDRARERFINGHSLCFGYGRVNAHKAVEKAVRLP